MYRKISLSILSLFVIHLVFAIQGELPGVFSVSPTKKVRFSQGNLEFNAALGTHQCADGTTKNGTWRFALNQYDKSISIDKRSPTYNGWIGLFSWGTSGWNSTGSASTAQRYEPWEPYNKPGTPSVSTGDMFFGVGGSTSNSITGKYANGDWGMYNAISNGGNVTESWRVLTANEWKYLLEERPQAKEKLFYGYIIEEGGGIILLPDDWDFPEFSYTPLSQQKSPVSIESATWKILKQKGAVLLPILTGGGYSMEGAYWSSSPYNKQAYAAVFTKFYINSTTDQFGERVQNTKYRYQSLGVRLVRDVVDETYTVSVKPNNVDFGTTTGGTIDGSLGEQLTISATPKECYLFYNWSDGNTDNPRSITIEGDTTYVAVFVKQQYMVTTTVDNDEQGSVSATAE